MNRTYVAPVCTTVELNCESSFCLVSSGANLGDVNHNGFTPGDSFNGWDD